MNYNRQHVILKDGDDLSGSTFFLCTIDAIQMGGGFASLANCTFVCCKFVGFDEESVKRFGLPTEFPASQLPVTPTAVSYKPKPK